MYAIGDDIHGTAAATTNITNQILYAKMHGWRPILVSMGFNAFSSNWRRLSNFMRRCAAQYGRLDFAVRIPMHEKRGKRMKAMSLICPHEIGKQAFGFYDAHEIVHYNFGQSNDDRIEQFKYLMDGYFARGFYTSTVMGETGFSRLEKTTDD